MFGGLLLLTINQSPTPIIRKLRKPLTRTFAVEERSVLEIDRRASAPPQAKSNTPIISDAVIFVIDENSGVNLFKI